MKILLRNFLSIARRFKMAMTLNMAGLSVAFAAFMVILMQVRYEHNFDRCYPNTDRIFRVDLQATGWFGSILSRGLIEEVIASSPHIEAGTLLCPYIGEIYFTVGQEQNRQGYKQTVYCCHPAFPQVFGLSFVEGDAHCLEQPDKVIIPQSMARKMFGNESAVGKSLHAEEPIWNKDEKILNYSVGAVYQDLPGNTQLRNVIYTAIDPEYMRTTFSASNYICYLLLDNASNAREVADGFNRSFDFATGPFGDASAKIELVPLTDIYYQSGSEDARLFRGGDKETTLLMLGIAILILVVAAINFTNFSTSLTPLRIRCINTQKVLGSNETSLRIALLGEACLMSMAAWLIALFLIYLLDEWHLLSFVEADLGLISNLPVVLISGLVALFTGLLAGLYPSWYVTSFPPALALKGSFGLSPSGRKLRTALMGIQFVFSVMLIIASFFIRLQNSYMRHYQLGFDKDQVAIVELSTTLYNKYHETYANRLKEYPGIEDVAFAMEKVGSQDGYNTNSATYKGEKIQYYLIGCSYNFLDLMGIEVEEGRDFTKSDEVSSEPCYILNRKAREQYQLELGDAFGYYMPGRMVGFVGDVKLTSLRQEEGNIAFSVASAHWTMPISYIRLKAGTDVYAAVEHIRKTLNELDPSYPFQIEFYDTIFDQLYHKEELFHSMILVLSLLAVLLSLVGVFGLVVFDSEYRRKEIGIRKVHGATVGEILLMFNRTYLRIVLFCFVIAAPLAWYGVSRWLENFAYKTPMYLWVYVVALLLVSTITIATVSFQNWRAANANPVDSIKSE